MNICIIPARGGSKRIPKKNSKLFNGIPIISYAITNALNSQCFDRVVVSTDDKEISEIARGAGAETPFVRPSDISNDITGLVEVVQHFIQWLHGKGIKPTNICLIYATAPFLRSKDIIQGLDALGDADFSIGVTSYSSPIQRAMKITKDGKLKMFEPNNYLTRSQDLEEAWHDAGQFVWGKTSAWISGIPPLNGNTNTVELSRYRVIDIDTMEDWNYAELMQIALSQKHY